MDDLENKFADFGKAASHFLRQTTQAICSRRVETSNTQSSNQITVPPDENANPNKVVWSPGGRTQSRFFQNPHDALLLDDESTSTSLSGSVSLSPVTSILPFECSACAFCGNHQKNQKSSPWHASYPFSLSLPPLLLPPAVQDLSNKNGGSDVGETPSHFSEGGITCGYEASSVNKEISAPSSIVESSNNLVLSSPEEIINGEMRDIIHLSRNDYESNSSENSPQRDNEDNSLAVDLSWLDEDDEAFEHKMLANTVGKHIQVFLDTENLWRTGLVISKLPKRQHVNIYMDGEERDVNLGSLLWRVSKV